MSLADFWASMFPTPAVPPEPPPPAPTPVAPVQAQPSAQAASRADAVAAGVAVFTANFEGEILHPYQDSAGVWTIGIGSTRGLDGNRVTAATPPISHAQALSLLSRDMRSAILGVEAAVKVPLTLAEEEALADFVYNVGIGNFKASTLLRKLNAGDRDGAAAEFEKWNLAGGRVLAGLVRRRASEKALFETKTD